MDYTYTYYRKIMSDEHYLAAKEVANYLYRLGFCSKSGKVLTTFVAAMLNDYESKNNIEPTYYCTKKGMMRVYPNWCAALYNTINELETKLISAGDSIGIPVGAKKYHVCQLPPT